MSVCHVSPTRSEVVGIDASLNSLGIAGRRRGETVANALGNSKLRGMSRIKTMQDSVARWLDIYQPRLVAFEGYALGFRGRSNAVFDIGEMGGVLKMLILSRGIDILLVPPTNMKMFITGKGNADKDSVAFAIRERLGVSYATSDQYDATGLLLMGEAYLDRRLLPRDRKHYQRRAIQGCTLVEAFCN